MLILTISLLYFFLVSIMVAPPLVAIEGAHWARDGPKFVYMVRCIIYNQRQFGTTFVSTPQCDHGAEQA
jgi:hypothetical protein